MVDPRAVDHGAFTPAAGKLDGLEGLVGDLSVERLRGAGPDALREASQRLDQALTIVGNAFYSNPRNFCDPSSNTVLAARNGLAPVENASTIPLRNPSNGAEIASVPMMSAAQVSAAVQFAAERQADWGSKPLPERLQVLHRMAEIVERHKDGLAELIHRENGKTLAEARGEIARGIDSIRFAAGVDKVNSVPGALQVGGSTTVISQLEPRGVVAGITPFNFPAMIPLWQAPLAIALGNAFVLKPSEQTPLTAVALADMWTRAGLPEGIFSVVHGGKETVQALIGNDLVKAVGFVGSSAAAEAVFKTGTARGIPVRALGGAKNHMIVMPDADLSLVDNMVGSITGCAGQRCMAASVLLLVGDSDHVLREIKSRMEAIVPGKDMGPVISERALSRITGYVDSAANGSGGAKLLLDGRNQRGVGSDSGYFIGPSIIEVSDSKHSAACDEIFGPLVTVIRCPDLASALRVEIASPYGNAVSVFTNDLKVADIVRRANTSGMIGVNVGVPVPAEPHGFGGFGMSSFGEGDLTGPDAVTLWARTRKATIRA